MNQTKAFFSGTISWMSTIYLDVVKSRIQADDPKNPYYKGTIDCFQKCYKEGGLRIFTRGWLVTALRAFPLNGATFLGFVPFVLQQASEILNVWYLDTLGLGCSFYGNSWFWKLWNSLDHLYNTQKNIYDTNGLG